MHLEQLAIASLTKFSHPEAFMSHKQSGSVSTPFVVGIKQFLEGDLIF